MKPSVIVATAVMLTGTPSAWADGTAAVGAQKIKSLNCITCHGRDGVAKLPEAANLAGQGQIYLESALKAYRSGERKNEIMNTVAQPLTDADVADLTAYYSNIQVSVTPPPKP